MTTVDAALLLRRAAGCGSSDPAPNYVKVDPLVLLAVADLLDAAHTLPSGHHLAAGWTVEDLADTLGKVATARIRLEAAIRGEAQ